jgi:dTDP-4-amino-4,6-dideoxygalactose transaminase
MSVPLLDLRAQHATIRADVVAAATTVIDEQAFILGERVAMLEREIAALSHTRHAVACASGTDALLLAFRALDIGRDDEVIAPTFTFFATAGAIHNIGARPVFCDIDPRTFNINPESAAAVRTVRTKAVVPVDLFGQVAPLEHVAARLPGLPIVEDAAQSIGARRKVGGVWRVAGELATIGTLSFFPSKNLGAFGDGGMMLTQDDALQQRLMRLRMHGGTRLYFHDEVGFNSRLDALQAAVLRVKLTHLATWSDGRRSNAAYYSAAFADVPDIVTPYVDPASEHIFNQYTIRVPRRDALMAHLKAKGIGHSVYYPLPLHLQPCFSYLGYKEGACPEAERAAKEVLSLPIYPELTVAQRDEVVAAVRGFHGH